MNKNNAHNSLNIAKRDTGRMHVRSSCEVLNVNARSPVLGQTYTQDFHESRITLEQH